MTTKEFNSVKAKMFQELSKIGYSPYSLRKDRSIENISRISSLASTKTTVGILETLDEF